MNGSLYLFPDHPGLAPDTVPLRATLEHLQLIGQPLAQDGDKQVFQAGDGFAREVIYAGCSPHLRFEPARPGDRDFCHVALLGPLPSPGLWLATRPGKPRCPQCRARLDDGAARAAEPLTPHPCPACTANPRAVDLDWRQQAAVGRVLVELRNVFPGEATPSDRLLAALREAAGCDWRHGWAAMSEAP